jgi:hypothetical protein
MNVREAYLSVEGFKYILIRSLSICVLSAKSA